MPPKLTLLSNEDAAAAASCRPFPPEYMRDTELGQFAPSPELREWVWATFLTEASPLYNENHRHLVQASIGYLWADGDNRRQQRSVIGTAELVQFQCSGWKRQRQELQLREWFGLLPIFLITLSAPFAFEADDATFCALVEHELSHCAQDRDRFGAPKFNRRTGAPLFAMRDHDVGQFNDVVRRYGADAAGVRDMVAAANQPPLLRAENIAGACGTCTRAA